MAWHILHGLLEQVRVHSTFPGKMWIFLMFVFRIVIVARIGDMVYHDEQSSFICNTLTPGCENVCFNGFSPISQLRFWSLSVLVVAVPGIFFYIYSLHKIYHASVKFPEDPEDAEEDTEDRKGRWDTDSCSHPPGVKRKRDNHPPPSFANATAPPLYEVKRLNSRNSRKNEGKDGMRMREMDHGRRRKLARNNRDEDKDLIEKRRGSTTDNNYTPTEDFTPRKYQHWGDTNRNGFPIYADNRGTKVEYLKKPKVHSEAVRGNKEKKLFLEHPMLCRAYWWHVVFRTILEAGFLLGQYYLYGWIVPEVYKCTRQPCFEVVYCYVSRPMEKSCLMWIMYSLGFFACFLSLAEFWTLGFRKFKNAVCCCGRKNRHLGYEEKRRRLARYAIQHASDAKKEGGHNAPVGEAGIMHREGYHVSLDSLSSDTTVESV